jgi:UDP:flavonoid glycosyltransferase YjiC (YdhE family)
MAMCAIGRELVKRGHDFLLIGTPIQATQLRLTDIRFRVVGGTGNDPVAAYFARNRSAGKITISSIVEYMRGMADLLSTELPSLFRDERIDAILADQEEPGAASAADLAKLPYATVCASLPLNADPQVPPGFLPWGYSRKPAANLRNRAGYAIRNLIIGRVNRTLNRHRSAAGLPLYRRPDDSFSKLAQVTQLVREFDFPRRRPLPELHYVGTYHQHSLFSVEFPWNRLNGRPIVYASFGTSFGHNLAGLEAISVACAALPVQLIISLGGITPGAAHSRLAGEPIVVAYAPQRDILSRAVLAITHAGLNSTMEALSLGVPVLAMPMAGDQFGTGARIEWHGVGWTLSPERRSAEDIKAAVQLLLQDRARWTAATNRVADAISKAGGAARAATIIERLTN